MFYIDPDSKKLALRGVESLKPPRGGEGKKVATLGAAPALLGVLRYSVLQVRNGQPITSEGPKEIREEINALKDIACSLKRLREKCDELESYFYRDDTVALRGWRSPERPPKHTFPVIIGLRWRSDNARDHSLAWHCEAKWHLLGNMHRPVDFDVIGWMPLPELPE